MDFQYCACGERTPITSTPARFCISCGEPFIKGTVKPTPKQAPMVVQAAKPKPVAKPVVKIAPKVKIVSRPKAVEPEPEDENDSENTETEDDYEDNNRTGNYDDLDPNDSITAQIVGSQSFKMGSVMGTGKEIIPIDKMGLRNAGPVISNTELMEQFKNEAGAIYPKGK